MKNKMKIRKFNQEGHQKWRDYYSDVFTNIKSIAKGRISPKDIIKGYDKNLQKRYQILKSDSDNFSEELDKSKDFKIIKFKNSFELAKSLHESLEAYDFKEIDIAEVYDWIAMILFEQIFVPGKIQGCDINRYVCNRDFFYSFRHLIRAPFYTYKYYKDDSLIFSYTQVYSANSFCEDYIKNSIFRESPTLASCVNELYLDKKTKLGVKGVSKGYEDGKWRDFLNKIGQLNKVKYLVGMQKEEILKLLPKRFNKYLNG